MEISVKTQIVGPQILTLICYITEIKSQSEYRIEIALQYILFQYDSFFETIVIFHIYSNDSFYL